MNAVMTNCAQLDVWRIGETIHPAGNSYNTERRTSDLDEAENRP